MSHVNLRRLNPYDLHKHLINQYMLIKPGCTKQFERDSSRDKRDIDIIRENHRFLWDNNDEADTWEKQLAKKYYDKLFKEYCICDLSRYKENKVALRWRIENELLIGKGQFICGNKICRAKDGLRSWEVNFAYIEANEKKNALIKLRLCESCSNKLNYHSKKREVKRSKRKQKKITHVNEMGTSTSSVNASTSVSPSNSTQNIDETNNSDEDDSSVIDDSKVEKLAEELWTKAPEVEDKSREEEFDEYLENLLL